VASSTALLVALGAGGWVGLANFAVVWLAAILFAAWVLRRIPGLTGDVYGALNELAEVAGLLWVAALGGVAL
jgi:cobalamin synthase